MKKLTHYVSKTSAAVLLLAPAFLFNATTAFALDEITVTARKTSENLQDVPLSITAITSEELDRLGVKDLDSLAQQDTSVQFDEGFNSSDTRITIRGLSPTRGRPNAAVLIDGVDITSEAVSNAGGSLLIDPRLIDVERIEIVKGPQSALYGRSAFAGAIQYVTKDPDDVLGGEVFIDSNHEGDKQVRGNLSIPINDTLGVRFNGLAWDNDGYYRNSATGGYVGGGEGLGGTVTFVYEPSDAVKFKWRTDYSKNEYDPPAQATLHDLNTNYDLGNSGGLAPENSNLVPQTSNCLPGGFLDNYDCGESQLFVNLLTDPSLDPKYAAFGPPGVGSFDPADPVSRNVYNKQVSSIFTGRVPDAKDLEVRLSPDYRKLSNGDERNAPDFQGAHLDVFRTSLVVDWDISDNVAFTSYSSYTDASDDTEIDLGKWYVDECSSTAGPGEDPAFAGTECGPGMGDGINDTFALFGQDSVTSTQQYSQEFRINWDVTDSLNFTSGLNYWKERVIENQLNLTLFAGGPVCYLLDSPGSPNGFSEASTDPLGPANGIEPEQELCGNSFVPTAFWANEVFDARTTQPSTLRRDVDHYSWYGSLGWNVTDKFTTTFEWRYTREDNAVYGPQQTVCIDINDAEINPDTGAVDCNGPESAAQVGPSAVIICGQTGRCENLADAPGGSWWDYGLLPQQGIERRLSRSDRQWAPKVTLEYAFTDSVNSYFSWSRGIKPGGYALLTIGAFGFDANNDGNFEEISYEPERLDVWELGAKTDLFDGQVRLNGAVYYQDFKDKQVSIQEVTGDQIGTRVENIDGSEIWGAEMDATWQATDNLRLNLGYTYTNSRYTDYTVKTRSTNDITRNQVGNGKGCLELVTFDDADQTPGCLQSYNSNNLERAPRNALALAANYSNNLFDTGKEWYAEANFRYQSSRWLEQYNIVEMPAYTRTNVSLGLVADTWDLQFYVNNLLDDDTPISGGANPGLVTGSFGFGFYGGSPSNLGVQGDGGSFPGINAGPKIPSDVYVNMPDPRVIGARLRIQFGG